MLLLPWLKHGHGKGETRSDDFVVTHVHTYRQTLYLTVSTFVFSPRCCSFCSVFQYYHAPGVRRLARCPDASPSSNVSPPLRSAGTGKKIFLYTLLFSLLRRWLFISIPTQKIYAYIHTYIYIYVNICEWMVLGRLSKSLTKPIRSTHHSPTPSFFTVVGFGGNCEK